MQKSLVALRNIAIGEIIQAGDLTCKRPATGLLPAALGEVMGKRAARAITADHVLVREDVDWDVP